MNERKVSMIMAISQSEVIKNGNSELVLFEGSNTGKKMYSFTTGGDLLMGRNIIRRSV